MTTQWKANRAANIVADQDRRWQRGKEMLDHSRLFLKLDATYLIAAGAILAYLKLNIHAILYQFGTYQLVPLGFVLLVSIDVLVYQHLFRIWMETPASKYVASRFTKVMEQLAASQPFIHLFFLTMLLNFVIGFASGSASKIDEF